MRKVDAKEMRRTLRIIRKTIQLLEEENLLCYYDREAKPMQVRDGQAVVAQTVPHERLARKIECKGGIQGSLLQ